MTEAVTIRVCTALLSVMLSVFCTDASVSARDGPSDAASATENSGLIALAADDRVGALRAFTAILQREPTNIRSLLGAAVALGPGQSADASADDLILAERTSHEAKASARDSRDMAVAKALERRYVDVRGDVSLDNTTYADRMLEIATKDPSDVSVVCFAIDAVLIERRVSPSAFNLAAKWNEAKSLLATARRTHPESMSLLGYALAVGRAEHGDDLEAARSVEQSALPIAAANLVYLAAIAELDAGNYSAAARAADAAVQADVRLAEDRHVSLTSLPHYVDHEILNFGAAFMIGRGQEASTALNRLRLALPWYPIIGADRRGRYNDAVAIADAFRLHEILLHGDWRLKYAAGVAYLQKGRRSDASALSASLLSTDGDQSAHVAGVMLAGGIAAESGNLTEARKDFGEALRASGGLLARDFEPWVISPLLTLASFEMKHGQAGAAIDAASAECRAHPESVPAKMVLYRAYVAAGDLSHAADLRRELPSREDVPPPSGV